MADPDPQNSKKGDPLLAKELARVAEKTQTLTDSSWAVVMVCKNGCVEIGSSFLAEEGWYSIALRKVGVVLAKTAAVAHDCHLLMKDMDPNHQPETVADEMEVDVGGGQGRLLI